MSDREDENDYEGEWLPAEPCVTCNGKGTVNELTAPSWFLCFGTETCPTCDGTGEAP